MTAVVAGLLATAMPSAFLAAVPTAHGADDQVARSGPVHLQPTEDPSDGAPTDHVETTEEAESADAARLAADSNMTVSEAKQQMELQRKAKPYIRELKQRFPESFGSARMSSRPGEPITIRFVGDVPPDAYEVVSPLGDSIVLVSHGTKRSKQAQYRFQQSIERAVSRSGLREAFITDDAVTGKVSVTARRVNSESSDRAKLMAQIPEADRAYVEFHAADGAIVDPMHTYGGAGVGNTTIGIGCTSGFTVYETATGVEGVTTAHHCQQDLPFVTRYWQPEDGLRYELNFKRGHQGEYGDFA